MTDANYLFSFIGPTAEWAWTDIPYRVWVFFAFASIAWFLRGAEIKVPESCNIWLFTVIFLGLIALVSFVLPVWATVFSWLLSIMSMFLLVVLASSGEENYRKLYDEKGRNYEH